jgi:ribosomal protein S12 methylthiotransferase
VLNEARALFSSGVKELLVVSQDTSAYGVDVKYRTGFWDGRPIRTRMTELVEALGTLAAEFDAWVRLHYVYPYPHVDEVLPLMAQGRILPYLDVPLQHAHPDVLKRMKRPASGERNLERIAKWREICPELVVRSTFIAGFPGETEEEFQTLLDFIREAELDRVGCFAYSPVDGAAANLLPNPVPDALREERRARFMAVAEEVSTRKLQKRVGQVMRVLLDQAGREGGIGRSYADAPEIDGKVHLLPPDKASQKMRLAQSAGQFVRVRIVRADGHDLIGELI